MRTLLAVVMIGISLAACAKQPRARALETRSTLPTLSDSGRALALDVSRVWSSDSVEEAPEVRWISKIASRRTGDYPAPSAELDASRVIIRFIIDTSGRAEPASIRALAPFDPARARAAMQAVLQAEFKPARIGGRPVRVTANLPFDFPRGW